MRVRGVIYSDQEGCGKEEEGIDHIGQQGAEVLLVLLQLVQLELRSRQIDRSGYTREILRGREKYNLNFL